MMKIFRNKEDSLKFGLSFFLLAGAMAGSVFCNKMSEEMKAELCTVWRSMVTTAAVSQMESATLLIRIFLKRLWMLMLVFLMWSTPYISQCSMLFAGYLGLSAAMLICPLTMAAGVLGIWKYLLLIFPQCLVYIPLSYLVLWWMPSGNRRLTWTAALALILVIFLGSVAESLVNPWFLTFL